ncbi:ankyrin repeat-containing domain protein [Aspergillus californicus]
MVRALCNLPSELILLISLEVDTERDLNSLAQTSRRISALVNPVLYRRNVQSSDGFVGSALRWAVSRDLEATVLKCLAQGASINLPPASAVPNRDERDVDSDSYSVDSSWEEDNGDKWSLICIASENGYDHLLRILLEHGATPNGYHHPGEDPVSLAIRKGHDTTVQLLLSQEDIDLDARNNPREVPLYYALKRGSLELVRALLEKGADLAKYESKSYSALDIAIVSGNQRLVGFLVQQGCKLNGHSLAVAAKHGLSHLVHYILAHGVDPNAVDRSGETPIGCAARCGYYHVIQILIAEGANPDIPDPLGRTPLSGAATGGFSNVVNLLLENGADPNSQDNEGRTPVIWAACTGSVPVLQALFAHGGLPGLSTPDNQSPISEAARKGHPHVVQLLIDLGVEIDNKDTTWFRTPLSLAAEGFMMNEDYYVAIVQLLLAHGADVNSIDRVGDTPVDRAIRGEQDKLAELLLRWGAKPKENPKTLLVRIVESGLVRVTRFLLKTDCDPDVANRDGYTPLMMAAECGNLEIANLLFDTGKVNIHACDCSGWTPLAFASYEGHDEMVKLLIEKGASPAHQKELEREQRRRVRHPLYDYINIE